MDDHVNFDKEEFERIPQMQLSEQRINRESGSDEFQDSAESRVDHNLHTFGVKGYVEDPVDMQLESTEGKDQGGDQGDKGLESVKVKDDVENWSSAQLQSPKEKGCDEDKVSVELQSSDFQDNVEVPIDISPKNSERRIDPMLRDGAAMDIDDDYQVGHKSQSRENKEDTKVQINLRMQSPDVSKDDAQHKIVPQLQSTKVDDAYKINQESQSSVAKHDVVHQIDVKLQSPEIKDHGEDPVDMQLEPFEVKDEALHQIDPQMRLSEVKDDVRLPISPHFQSHEASDHIQYQTDVKMQSPKTGEDAGNPNVLRSIEVKDSVKNQIDTHRQTPENADHEIYPALNSNEFKGDFEYQNDPQTLSPQVNDKQERRDLPPQSLLPSMPTADEMLAVLTEMQVAFAGCLPQEELKYLDLYSGPSQQVDAMPELKDKFPAEKVEKNMGNFMSAAKKLEKFFIGMQQPDPPSKSDELRKEIAMMEEELKIKDELIEKHGKKFEGWTKEVKEQLCKHGDMLRKV